MSSIQLPSEFAESYANFEAYPTKLIYNTTYPSELALYRSRFEATAGKLCTEDEDAIDVGFRDFDLNGQKGTCTICGVRLTKSNSSIDALNLQDVQTIKWRLGDLSLNSSAAQRKIAQMVTKKDPRCRFM
jgi:hypothetical protein